VDKQSEKAKMLRDVVQEKIPDATIIPLSGNEYVCFRPGFNHLVKFTDGDMEQLPPAYIQHVLGDVVVFVDYILEMIQKKSNS